jgi:hypothetical protein
MIPLLLGEFEKLGKATISCVMSVRRSVRSLGSYGADFHEIVYLSVRENASFIKN